MMLREDRHQRLLPHLPLLSQLPNNREIIIDWMSDDHMTETYELIQQCAEDGHGFGVDEFQNEEEFRDEIRESFCFVVIDERTKELIASFIMTSSKFYRGSPDAVDPYIIVRPNDRQKGIGEFCMRKVLESPKFLDIRECMWTHSAITWECRKSSLNWEDSLNVVACHGR